MARFSPELRVPLPSQPPAFPVFAICNQAGFLLSALFSFFFSLLRAMMWTVPRRSWEGSSGSHVSPQRLSRSKDSV